MTDLLLNMYCTLWGLWKVLYISCNFRAFRTFVKANRSERTGEDS
jgi:hypothetical protein